MFVAPRNHYQSKSWAYLLDDGLFVGGVFMLGQAEDTTSWADLLVGVLLHGLLGLLLGALRLSILAIRVVVLLVLIDRLLFLIHFALLVVILLDILRLLLIQVRILLIIIFGAHLR